MNNDQAKEILKLYRPGTADADDPSFAGALELCARDAELKRWFEEHCAVYAALRAKFKQIAVPEGLKEQIISERRVQTTPVWQRSVIAAGSVALIVLILTGLFSLWRQPREPRDFSTYRARMVGLAQNAYGMQLETTDLDQIRAFFARTNAIADYALPEGLKKNAQVTGCVATIWRGKPVAMICFQTGRPLSPGAKSDLWLFISDRDVASATPASDKPKFETRDEVITASWTINHRTYVLATKGDEEFLRKFL
jgi:hypothetical protein